MVGYGNSHHRGLPEFIATPNWGAASNCGIQIKVRIQNIHGQCRTNGSLEDDGGRDARDPRIVLYNVIWWRLFCEAFAKIYGCPQPYLNFFLQAREQLHVKFTHPTQKKCK